MKVKIYKQNMLRYLSPEEREMSPQELYRLRQEIQKNLLNVFKWSDYNPKWNHLLYYAEMDDVAYVYPCGYLYTEDDFCTKIQCRADIKYAGVWHRRS